VILCEHPVLLTFPVLACELFENPTDLVGGLALARCPRSGRSRSCGTATATSSCRAARLSEGYDGRSSGFAQSSSSS
jgi:hypothetical protein